MHFFSGLITFILTEVSSTTRQLLGYFSALEQMGTLSRGEIDTRPIVLYLSLTIVMLGSDLSGISIAQMETVIVVEKPKKIHRFQIGLNVVVQIGLLIFLALMVNYLGFEHYRRWDFSRDQKYALSDKTKRMLDSLKGETAHHCFLFPKHADHQRRARSANGISVRRQRENRR